MEFVAIRPPEEIGREMKRLYSVMGRYMADFMRASPARIPPYRVTGEDVFRAALAEGKGTLLLLGHYGNWEVILDIFGKTVSSFNVVAKPMHNALVDRWLADKRKATGADTIYMDQAMRKLIRVLRSGGMVAVLIDQHPGTQGTLVPFLGKKTATVRTVAWLVQKTGCAVLPLYGIIRDDNSYDVVFSRLPPLGAAGKSEDEVITAIQEQHNEVLSAWVRRAPEHWFGWFHKRFKESDIYQ